MDEEIKELEIGKGEVLQDGTDLAIFAYGHMVDPSMKAAALLEEKGLSVAVINARFAKPIDQDLVLEYARKTGCIVTTEEHSVQGGFGSAVLECLQEINGSVPPRVKCIGVGDAAVEHGASKILRKDIKLDPEGMFETIFSFYNSVLDSSRNDNSQGNGAKGSSGNGKEEHSVITDAPLKIKQPVNE